MACIGLLLFNGYNRAFRPYLYDKSNYYYKAYHYKVKKIKPQKKIVKDIEIEVLHFVKDDFPDNLSTYKDSHYTDKGIDPRRLFLHITFTDNTNMTLPFRQVTLPCFLLLYHENNCSQAIFVYFVTVFHYNIGTTLQEEIS